MALIRADRIVETTTGTGTGALTLAGAVAGYRDFDSVMNTADTCYYAIEAVDSDGIPTGAWETGLGTFNSTGPTLTRTSVHFSSNSNAAVSFAAGTKRVFMVVSATDYAALLARVTANEAAITALQGKAMTYRVGLFWTTALTSNEVILLHTFSEAATFADDFAGSIGDVGANPASSFVLDVQKNGSSIGSITISTGGSFTFATTGGTAAFAVGDQLKIVGPSTVGTAASVSITMKATID